MKPQRIINARAPTRINDLGGWTDTWFAGRGKVLNTAVLPGVEVQIRVFEESGAPKERVLIHLENEGGMLTLDPEKVLLYRNPMVEAAFLLVRIPQRLRLEINIYSGMPAGSATGTSASLSVALLGALCRLAEKRLSPLEIANMAHRLETEVLKLQSGIQDQFAAAFGGINCIDMYQYPQAHLAPLNLGEAIRMELENRLLLVCLGQGHRSSDLHQKVIAGLERTGPENPLLAKLRWLAECGQESLEAGDFVAFGRVMNENTGVQAELHPELVSSLARSIIEVANANKALGCKVNGAGGTGGSLTILCEADMAEKRRMAAEIEKKFPECRVIPIRLAGSGLTVWETS